MKNLILVLTESTIKGLVPSGMNINGNQRMDVTSFEREIDECMAIKPLRIIVLFTLKVCQWGMVSP